MTSILSTQDQINVSSYLQLYSYLAV